MTPDGASLLARHLESTTLAALAAKLGGKADHSMLSRYVRRERRPSLAVAMALEDAAGIPASSWIKQPRKRGRGRVR